MNKRFPAALLALVMVCALLPTAALASDSDFVMDEDGVLKEYTGPGGDVVIPDGVTGIGDSAFYDCKSLTSVTIPASVTSIGPSAFYNCFGLTDVTIPEGVTTVEDFAFQDCIGLTSVTIPDSVTTIGGFAFDGCESLTSVTIPGSVTSIPSSAFSHCYDLTSVTILEGVISIGNDAFYNCNSLADVTIPSSVTHIEEFAFGNCASLTSVTIPDSVTLIGSYAFSNCTELVEVTVPYEFDFYGSLFEGSKQVTVYGYVGSPMEYSCMENQVPFVPIGAYPGHGWSGALVGADGELAWAMTDDGTLTVDAAGLAPEEKVLVGCYDNDGRFVSVKVLDAQTATVQLDPTTPHVKIFWLGAGAKPQSSSVTVWGR